VYQLQENLFNKVNMVTQDNKRWKCGQYFSWQNIHDSYAI
jgi:hypothetical protein